MSIQIRDPIRTYTRDFWQWYLGVSCNGYSLNARSSRFHGWLPALAQRKHWPSIKPQEISKSVPCSQLLSLHRTRICKGSHGNATHLQHTWASLIFSASLTVSVRSLILSLTCCSMLRGFGNWWAGAEQRSFQPAVLPTTEPTGSEGTGIPYDGLQRKPVPRRNAFLIPTEFWTAYTQF